MRKRPNIVTGLIALLLWFWAATAQALEVDSAAESIDLVPHLVFAQGTAAHPEEMRAFFQAGVFSKDASLDRFEGNHAAEIWGAVEITAKQSFSRRVVISIPMISEVDVYAFRDGELLHVLDYSIFEPFDPGQRTGMRIQSQILDLPAQSSFLLLLHFKFGPVQSIDLSLESAGALQQRAIQDVAILAGFYAFALAAICVFLAYFAALRDVSSLLYACLFFTALLFLAYMDGLLFQFLYPSAPQIQSSLGFFLFLSISGFGFMLAGFGFRQRGAFRAERVCWGFTAATVALYGLSLISPGPIAAILANFLLITMCVCVVLSTRHEQYRMSSSHRVSRILGLVVAAGILVLIAPLIIPAIPAPFDLLTTTKMLFLLLIVGGLANLTAQILSVRRAQEDAQAAELAALSREADISRQLAGSERNYAKVQALAASRQQKLATAAHDIRQPVQSLRLRLDSLSGSVAAETDERLREALDYIETLTAQYLKDGNVEEPEQEEVYDVSLILDSVHRMFLPEAQEKGLSLRVVRTSEQTSIPAAALMRIACNLVVNAIKHSDQGAVVLGVKRKNNTPFLCVVDTGPGFTPEDYARFTTSGEKGDNSEGHGLGLAVCVQTAEELRIELTVNSVPGRGTAFYLGLKTRD